MNEELKIIIRAVTDEAKRNLAEVKKELERVGDEAEDSGKAVDKAMSTMGKAAMAAVGAVVAITTAIVTLGKRSVEFQKTQAQLIAGFQAVGLSASEASKVYKELFGFLGEADTATETANLLAQLTQDTKQLGQWTEILMGVYAKFPDSLPIESLAESINHTARMGVVHGNLSDALEWSGISVESFNGALANTTTLEERELLIRSTLNNLYMGASQAYSNANQALIAYNQSQVALDQALANATAYVVPLLTALNNLGATLLHYLKPAFETVAAVIVIFVQWIIAAIKAVGSFFGIFSKSSSNVQATTQTVNDSIKGTVSNANKLVSGVNKVGNSLNKATKAAKELKRQTMGFDELNILSSQKDVSTGAAGGIGGIGGGGAGAVEVPKFEIPEIAVPDLGEGINLPDLDEFEKKVEKIREYLKPIGILVAGIAAGFALWKIASLISDAIVLRSTVAELAKKLGSTRAAFRRMSEAEANMDKFKITMKYFAGIGLAIAGAIALVTGFSDAWVNGIDWTNFGLILGGIALTVGGMLLAFGPTAGAIALIAGGVIALIAGVKDLVTNGYSLEAVLTVVVGAIAAAVGIMAIFNATLLANPITWVVIGIAALVAAFIILWNECEGFRKFWINLWEKAKATFNFSVIAIKALIETLKQKFGQAGEAIKNAWSAVANFFRTKWNEIGKIFSNVGSFFKEKFKTGLDNIKNVFSGIGPFFEGVLTKIKKIFSRVGDAIGSAVSKSFSKAINWVLDKAIGIINGFISAINAAIGIINKIPGVNIKKLSKLDVPKLATGGITTGATLAMIGERGREAVLPLENNTGWMDALANKIAERNSSPSKIVLMLDGKELGWANIRSINNITKQTGALQLVLG